MLDMGFLRDIERVMKLMPDRRQNLMFSATFSKEIKKLANSILHKPVQVEVTPENSTVDAINQKVYRVAKSKKTALILKLILDGQWNQVLVFTRTKHGANKLTKKMLAANISAAAIHGNKSQGARTKALAGFKNRTISVLVATDIAARGLDIPLLPHVINFEIPNISEDYVHRIGRTGRAGAKGEAISLVCTEELGYLKDIEKLVGLKISSETLEGFEPDPNEPNAPKKKQQGQSRNSNSRNRNRNNKTNNQSNKNKNRRPSSRNRRQN
ncbi:MAG: DEAD/DEAH box helicase, partial [Oceanihabitans sp.]